jgi:hypothetical protein
VTHAPPDPKRSENARERLRRLNELIAATPRIAEHWLESLIGDTLKQDPAGANASCPSYAGIISESSDHAITLGDSVKAVADELANGAASEIPITPIAMVDLDTGQRYPAELETGVSFDGYNTGGDRELVLVIVTEADTTEYRLASNDTDAVLVLAEWARAHWAQLPKRGPAMPTDPAARVGVYFDRAGPHATYQTRAISAP